MLIFEKKECNRFPLSPTPRFTLTEPVETAVVSCPVEPQRQVDAIEQVEPVGCFAAVPASAGLARGARRTRATRSRLCRLRA